MIYVMFIHGPVLEKCDVVIKKVCDIKTAGVNFNTFDFRLFQEKNHFNRQRKFRVVYFCHKITHFIFRLH